jgi:glycosyltransferase involved in cell wall biosynthesis
MTSKYITCVTISKNDEEGLLSTLKSVDLQTRKPYEHIVVVSNTQNISEIVSKYSQSFRTFIIDHDKSLYNAMNVGICAASGNGVYFLNGGDIFNDERSYELLCEAFVPGKCLSAKVAMTYKNLMLIRPGSKKIQDLRTSPPHQGFVAPLSANSNELIFFDECQGVSADTVWIRENINRFSCNTLNSVVAIFALDGVSNSPSINLIRTKYGSQGMLRIKVFIKIILDKIIGRKLLYWMIGVINCYDIIWNER